MEHVEKPNKVAFAWHRLMTFLRDVRVEMTKVTWPTWEELTAQTLVVIIAACLPVASWGAFRWLRPLMLAR